MANANPSAGLPPFALAIRNTEGQAQSISPAQKEAEKEEAEFAKAGGGGWGGGGWGGGLGVGWGLGGGVGAYLLKHTRGGSGGVLSYQALVPTGACLFNSFEESWNI